MKRLAWGMVLLQLAGCATGSGVIYFEPSVQRQTVAVRRVAIVPNRLPLMLQNSEFWQKTNWEIVRREFQDRGFDVVDYDTSVSAFNRSGLPVEDTKSSRDKYADLAQQLGVDMVVIPYYGTFGSATSMLLLSTSNHIGVATFQFFLASKNDFFSRVDASGKTSWTSGWGTILGIVFGGAGAGLLNTKNGQDAGLGMTIVGGVAMLAGLFVDLIVGLIPDNSKWTNAFNAGIHAGLKPFFEAFPGPQGNGARAPNVTSGASPPPNRAPGPSPVANPYNNNPPPPPPPVQVNSPPPPPRRAPTGEQTNEDQVLQQVMDGWRGPSPHVAVVLNGSQANPDKQRRCDGVVTATGAIIDRDAAVSAMMTLEEKNNRLSVVSKQRGVIMDKVKLPSWGMERLCKYAVSQVILNLQEEMRAPAPSTQPAPAPGPAPATAPAKTTPSSNW